jgi:Uma2 family endonuclease
MLDLVAAPEWTVESYLALEESSLERHEFVNGRIYPMAGGSYQHARIKDRFSRLVGNKLDGGPCEPTTSDVRVRIGENYVYPDVTIVCGEPEIEQDHGEHLLNPILIVEVTSPSTSDYDRGAKFRLYRSLPSLMEYLVFSQDEMFLEQHVRQGEAWVLLEFSSPDTPITLPSLQCQITLAEIYAKTQSDEGP